MMDLLWSPSSELKQRSAISHFMTSASKIAGLEIKDYSMLYNWSLESPSDFWGLVWDFCNIKSSKPYSQVLQKSDGIPGVKWFVGSELNFAENLLRRRDNKIALIFHSEDKVRKEYRYGEVAAQVSSLQQFLVACGVKSGDRVAGLIPTCPEAIIAMLATTSIGAVWSSCSPDFGVRGIMDRFGQIEPKVLFTADSYFFKGNEISIVEKATEVTRNIPSITQTVVSSFVNSSPKLDGFPIANSYNDVLASYSSKELTFAQLPFDHPLYIMYSSGTTGLPKCIVHSAGGTLLEHLKELCLHTNLSSNDNIFYYTTCGWMMWNWLVSSMAVEATVTMFDGSPFHPNPGILFDLIDREKISIFGTSAKYISAIEKSNVVPKKTHSLSSLKTILSTGSPLLPESFDYVYRDIKSDVCLSSISGGTDIIGCFALGNPTLPVYRGEIQCRSLGLKVEVFTDQGRSIVGEKGELVCTNSFPSMPIYFWNDPNSAKYRKAYFERFPGVWHHGDFAEVTERGGMKIYGRSDAVLNPGGVRIGTAEIYRIVEQFEEVQESLVIGQDWKDDVRVILFVKLSQGHSLTDTLKEKIRVSLRNEASPRHVPSKIIQVSDIPKTINGKIVELAVRNIIHGIPVTNKEALLNPEALKQFENLSELKH